MQGFDNYSDYEEEDLKLEEILPGEVTEPYLTEQEILEQNLFDEKTEFTLDAPDSLLNSLLKAKGIVDSKIVMIGEDDVEKEVNFYDLSVEEQLEILNAQAPEETPESELDATEIDLINHLRTNNLSVNDFLTQYKEAILAEAQMPATEATYEIDAYDDQELFLYDLKSQYDLTDEELQLELEKELTNPDLFNKKVTKLRAEYKELENQYKLQQQTEFEAQRQEQYNQFSSTMNTVAGKVEDFHGVFLEDNEKAETLSYLLDLDESGTSQFSKDLNNPSKLYEAAWYMRYGAEAFKALENAYEAEITKLKKVDKPRVVVQNSKPNPQSIYDLH